MALIFLLISVIDIVPLTFRSSVVVNHDLKKRVIFIDEVHARYINGMVNPEQRKVLTRIYYHQKSIWTALGNALVGLGPAMGSQCVVITETNPNSCSCLVEEEAGAIGERDTGETLDVVPRIFLRRLFAPVSTVNARISLFNNFQPFNTTHAVSFVLDNNVRWIVGDRARTKQDAYLSFYVYRNWQQIVDAIKTQSNLPQEHVGTTIGYVREYINELHGILQEHGIVDHYYQKISDVITNALATRQVQESDHYAFLHKHLIDSDNEALRDELNNTMIFFISQKFDVELRSYLTEFNNDQTLRYAFVVAGGEHNKQLRESLVSQGYMIAEQAGLGDNSDTIFDECWHDRLKLTGLLEIIYTHPPFVNFEKLLGVNIQKIPEPQSSFLAKYALRASCILGSFLR